MQSSASQALAYIRKRLMSGQFAAGTRLREEALARDLGISRTPVREAIRTLVADGFLQFKPNAGAFVAEWSGEEIRQLFDLRTLLESEIAEAAALSMTPAQLAELEEIQARLDRLGAGKGARAIDQRNALNRRFHGVIAEASGRTRLAAALNSAISMPVVQQTFRRYGPQHMRRSLAHHHELLDAFRARDPQWARAVMTAHIRAALAAMLGR
jgi:DNA-binding GntR family transcriptional regulator